MSNNNKIHFMLYINKAKLNINFKNLFFIFS